MTEGDHKVRIAFEQYAKNSGVFDESFLARWPSGNYVSPFVEAEYRGFKAGIAMCAGICDDVAEQLRSGGCGHEAASVENIAIDLRDGVE